MGGNSLIHAIGVSVLINKSLELKRVRCFKNYLCSLLTNIIRNAANKSAEHTRIAFSWKNLITKFPRTAPVIKQRIMP